MGNRPDIAPPSDTGVPRSVFRTGESTVTRTSLPTAAAASAAAAALLLTLTACGGGDSKTSDKIAGAESASPTSASPSPSATPSVQRPKIDLPSDLTYSFTPAKTGDPVKDAILYDNEQFMKATDLAIAHSNADDKAYQFYSTDTAAAVTRDWVKEFIDHKARTTGLSRFYDRVVTVRKNNTATLSFCEDERKNYNKYLKTGKVEVTKPSSNDFIAYNSELRKNSKGIWVTDKLVSQRGAAACQ
jgi:hypothetical protein